MATRVRDVETPEHVILVWTGEENDVLFNQTGVTSQHVTRVIRGSGAFTIEGKSAEVVLGRGEQIILPVKTPYMVRALTELLEIHCFYPKDVPGAVEDIEYLRDPERLGRARWMPSMNNGHMNRPAADEELIFGDLPRKTESPRKWWQRTPKTAK